MDKNRKWQSGIIDVSKIFEFVKAHPVIPCGRTEVFRQYSKLCDILTEHIPQRSGWYFWIRSRDHKIKHPIYIGKAGKTTKKNSLRYRINYELKTERICFWTDVVGKEKAFNDHHIFYNGKFDKSAARAQRKAGTKFIVWVSDLNITPVEISEVERILIDRHQPQVNIQRAERSHAFEKAENASILFQKFQNR